MNTSVQPESPSITQSPWYWAYVFCTGGLIALVVMGPRYAQRQAQIEKKGQARQQAAQVASGQADVDSPAASETLTIVLWPLFVVLGAGLALAWIKLIRDHLRRRRLAGHPPAAAPNEAVSVNPADCVSADGTQP